MRERIWDELAQSKHHEFYCVLLLAEQRKLLNYFNMTTLILSSAGIMGWPFWKALPLISCAIISFVQLLKLIQSHIIPSEKQIEKLDYASSFYVDYYNKIESLWFDYNEGRISDETAQTEYYDIKSTEKDASKVLREILKSVNKAIQKKADTETTDYLKRTFNT